MSNLSGVRAEVRAFALAMEERLRANDHKGGKYMAPQGAFNALLGEVQEAHEAIGLVYSRPGEYARANMQSESGGGR